MLHPVTVRTLALAACGGLLALDAAALTVGPARGAVLIGRPVELTIPVTLDAGDGASPCAEADLFHGDTKVRTPSVRFDAGVNRQGVLRLSSPQPVDEPMITVYLRVGCGQSFTRRYVMLAELPPEPESNASVVPPAPRALPTVPRAQGSVEAAPRTSAPSAPATRASPDEGVPASRSSRRGRDAPAAPGPATAAARDAAAVREGAPLAPPAPSRRSAAGQRADGSGTGRPRLQLDILDLTPARDPVLRLSTQLNLPAVTDPAARQSAADLWQALRRTPEENVQEGLRLRALERDIESLRSTTQQNSAAVTQMRQQVEQARGARDRVWLLPVLLAALLALLTGLAFWLWRRGRSRAPGQWFEGGSASIGEAEPPGVAAPLPAPAAVRPATPAPTATRRPRATPAPATDPAARNPVAAAMNKPITGWAPIAPATAEFETSVGGTVRTVGVQELIDVHDKADFFLSIGQPEQAIATLESHVHDQVETSALAWMDLMELYHRCGLRTEFERLRAEFIQRFAAEVPDFEHFDQPTSSLENYGRALSRIVALWPTRRVLSVIEESIFRQPGVPGAEPFSLEAYRELVLLYNMALEVSPPDDGLDMNLDHRHTDFHATSLQPLGTQDVDWPVLNPDPQAPQGTARTATPVLQTDSEPATDQERLMVPPSSHHVGLDIDLGEPEPDAAPPPALSRELPPLDFDTSGSGEPISHDPLQKDK